MAGILIGALIALVGSVFVQAFVVPRVNRRTRAIDRWEQDVLELGALISNEFSVAMEAAYEAWRSWSVIRITRLAYDMSNPGRGPLAEDEQTHATAFRQVLAEYERLVDVRLWWLAKRITSRDSRHVPYLQVELAVLSLARFPDELRGDQWTIEDAGQIDAWWKRQFDERGALLGKVELLAGSISAPSPKGPIARLQAWREHRRWLRDKKNMPVSKEE